MNSASSVNEAPPPPSRVTVPLFLRFRGPLEGEFLEDYYRNTVTATRLAAWGGLAFYDAFGALDYWLLPETHDYAWLLRFGVVSPIYLALILLSYTPLSRLYVQQFLATAMVVCGLSIVLMIVHSHESEPAHNVYFAGLILVHMGGYAVLSLRFRPAAIGNLAILFFYEVGFILSGNSRGSHEDRVLFLAFNFFLIGANVLALSSCYRLEYFARRDFLLRRALQEEQEEAERLLLNILPEEIPTELKTQQHTIARAFPEASILFADVVSFTPLTADMPPQELIDLLNEVFSFFDSLVDKHDVEKIKTLGDCYMAAAGVPVFRPDHAQALARIALETAAYVRDNLFLGHRLTFRIGINSGPVVAGVIGRKKFSYDLWGDIVNLASRMESQGREGSIQITRSTYELLRDEFVSEPLGKVAVKGVGDIDVWQLVSERPAATAGMLSGPAPAASL